MTVSLRVVSWPELGQLLAGGGPAMRGAHPEYPMSETFVAGRMIFDQGPSEWGICQILRPDSGGDDQVVGDIGFHSAPDEDGTVEIGYNVVESMRRLGIATAACKLILERARDLGASRVIADPDHNASARVLLAAGFQPEQSRPFFRALR